MQKNTKALADILRVQNEKDSEFNQHDIFGTNPTVRTEMFGDGRFNVPDLETAKHLCVPQNAKLYWAKFVPGKGWRGAIAVKIDEMSPKNANKHLIKKVH